MKSKLLSLLSIIRIGGLLIAALAMWGFAQIADEVLDKETQAIDTAILLTLRHFHSPLMDQMMVGITSLGEPLLLLILCIILGIALVMFKRRAEAATLVVAAAGAGGLNYLLKELFSRSRPALWNRTVDVAHYSFPSGHAMVSLVIYGMLGYLLSVYFPRWRWLIGILTLLLVTLIGLSRLYLGVHWPTDVVAGYSAGFVWLVACVLSLEVWRLYRPRAGVDSTEFF